MELVNSLKKKFNYNYVKSDFIIVVDFSLFYKPMFVKYVYKFKTIVYFVNVYFIYFAEIIFIYKI